MTESLLCVEITLGAPDDGLEDQIEESLWLLPIRGVERQDEQTWSALVEDPRPRLAGTVRWRVHLPDEQDVEGTLAAFRDVLPSNDAVSLDAWRLDDLSFLTRWREFFRPAQISPRIVVHPPWDVPNVDEGVVRVQIEPGMAFGTGTHETTRLCLRVLDDLLRGAPGAPVFDVGCGSGVLAIAAAKLGAERVLAIDNDPDAVDIAVENVAINGCANQVVCATTPVGDADGPWPIVVANILPHILEALRDDLWAQVCPDGALVLSGILLDEADRVRAAFERDGWGLTEQRDDGEWCALVWRPAVGG